MAKLLKKKSHVSDEADATEETREIVGVWNHSHKRAPKGHRRRWPAGQTWQREKRKRNPNHRKQRVGPAHPWRSGEHGVEMARRRGRADKAAMRLLLVPAPGRVTTSSSPTQQHQEQVRRTPASGSGLPVTKLLQCLPVLPRALGLGAMHVDCRVTIVRVGFVGCWFVHGHVER